MKVGEYRTRGAVAPQLILNVSAVDINKGVPKDARTCAIAQAIRRKFPEATSIVADMREVSFSLPSRQRRFRYFNPAPGAKHVLAFDRGETLEPFKLRLNDGVEFPMGWRSKHPGSTREGKVYKRTGKRAAVRYCRHREYGACNISRDEAEKTMAGLR